MLTWLRKRLALRGYRRKLGPALIERYGREKRYTTQQVRTTVEAAGLSLDYVCYAYAAFCGLDDFNAHHAATGETCDWAGMRTELATSFGFGGESLHTGHHLTVEHDLGHHHDATHDHGHHHDGGHDHGTGGHDGGGHH